MTTEEWRPIAGFPDYWVSSLGSVRSAAKGGQVLAATSFRAGYRSVRLRRVGESQMHYVHHLVAAAFIGPRPQGHEIRHLDGNKLNNDRTNLAYGTRSENARDRVRHGTDANRRKTRCAQGHPYDEVNTNTYRGRRICRTCRRAYDRALNERRAQRAAGVRTAA